MNNNDDLAMQARADFESWWEVHYHNGNPPRFGWAAYREDGGYKIDDDESELDAMWNAWRAAQNCMLAERDADKKRIAELEALTAEQDKRVIAYAAIATKNASEARTVSVKLPSLNPEMFNDDVMFGYRKAQKEAVEFCAAAGIKLEVGE
ncbi:hypothetical protein P8F81_08030 [Kosakonia cowanii]|uniref:hypothetical protein n=1 Tax=Kosakonia cowanii TaxID=208223 RepID=UPI002DDC9547|nr:hypothetical protein [Kosakonia cowanii]WRY60930.1 hypothetical protein P8F81_08030 [Kosakonia cowanii]